MFGFGYGFTLFQVMFFAVFALTFGIIIFTMVKTVGRWNKNNNSPRLTVGAYVVAKRTHVSHHHSSNDNFSSSSHTSYYVTFQVASGDRMELNVDGNEYGLLVEGDYGQLSFQGTRYLSFVRCAPPMQEMR